MLDHADLFIRAKEDNTTREFFHHSSAQRTFTNAVIAESLAKQYPDVPITVVPQSFGIGGGCSLLEYAAPGYAKAVPIVESTTSPLKTRSYLMPARRTDAGHGAMAEEVIYAKYWYTYKDEDYLLYIVSGRDGVSEPYLGAGRTDLQYLIGPKEHVADELIKGATEYQSALHDEIWVFDSGYWQKSRELYNSINKASWDDVILDPDMKSSIQNDVLRFFKSRERYAKLRVPWKRGIIYYGPPGNGKTISIKAMMHTLYHLADPVPSLYVRSLSSFGGPEYSIKQIFAKARQQAPCLLIFEDLDSLVRDNSRTYFLNEVDGLQVNDGVLMIGSTNHLELLDPGIAKRPSRFDRKYNFPKPNLQERVMYCDYWRGKLKDNKDIEFPSRLSEAIAKETENFSFAYMQEAFVASLLTIASEDEDGETGERDELLLEADEDGRPTVARLAQIQAMARREGYSWCDEASELEKIKLWRVIKAQIKILREEL